MFGEIIGGERGDEKRKLKGLSETQQGPKNCRITG